MKKIYLTLFAFIAIVLTTNVNAQTNVTSSGMSIQGIARDETNAAIANIDQLALVFTVYYLGTGNSEQVILTKSANVKTDNFGVFSYVLDIDQTIYGKISSQSTYLKVVQGSVVFSNEKLQAVPYAIFAQNGVPTGSIMPFIGTTAPNGWLLCNGSSFASLDVVITANLKALLGGSTNTPDLKGIFLRGIGRQCNAYGCYEGPELKAIQQDDLKSHLHAASLPTNSAGSHNHNDNSNFNRVLSMDGKYTVGGTDNNNGSGEEVNLVNSKTIGYDGAHTHTASGNTNNTGGTETRPINYGVNYIIKI
ncbi:tail fiber protein [Flavobacterium frigoris]|uniref:Phage Tail Collar n=1 Tax=Flavobacterium frigoris (strain PS1) TaxID=1086011 RepID=H7FQZ5_FLAFP|nr:tail fiber protein [Flavobacterium frigoris]EIA09132.1 phage Tail Collar [Flavobacterium frigoris PS1]